MTWITGTATDHKNMLSLLKGHLEDEGWTTNAYSTAGAAPNTDSLYVMAPGFGTGFENYTQIRTYDDAPLGYYCWEVKGATNYDSGQSFGAQPGSCPASSYLRLWNDSMTYWLSVSDRRFILIVKVSNTYHSLHCGFFNPFAAPTEYPYPYYQASDSYTVGAFGTTAFYIRCIAFPGDSAAWLRSPAGTWEMVCVYDGSSDTSFQTGSGSRWTVWPYNTAYGNGSGNNPGDWYFGPRMQVEPLPGYPDSQFAQPCYLWGLADQRGILGALEGVYWIAGNGMSAEQQITIDSDTFRAFIAISRSLVSYNQFYAIKEA